LTAYRKKGFENAAENPLLGLLPPPIYIPAASGKAAEWLASSLQLLAFEASLLRLGAKTVISRLSEITFVQAVRIWIASQPMAHGGWRQAWALARSRRRGDGRALGVPWGEGLGKGRLGKRGGTRPVISCWLCPETL
jgi:Cupin